MNVLEPLKLVSEHGRTDVVNGWKSVSIMQDSDEVLFTETEARQLHEWLGRALADSASEKPCA